MKKVINDFNVRLVYYMKQADVSVETLAYITGLSERTIYRYINGDTTPKVDTIASLANALEVSISELVGE